MYIIPVASVPAQKVKRVPADNDISCQLAEAELLVELLSVCSSETRLAHLEFLARDSIQELIDSSIPKALWLKSRLPNLGEEGSLSADEYDKRWLSLIRTSAENGCKEAEYDYACHLHERRLFERSIPLYRSSALKGYPPSLWCYGLELIQGMEIAKDEERGYFYIHMSAEAGYEYALDYLIDEYEKSKDPFGSFGNRSLNIEKLKILR